MVDLLFEPPLRDRDLWRVSPVIECVDSTRPPVVTVSFVFLPIMFTVISPLGRWLFFVVRRGSVGVGY